ncbi:MAG: ribosomal L7Ae/L30e/S12e/Gadd45 family protein [Anaeroplasmataceae bacterium]|nr:ribosomal L7Ae/L30e/S12e/Gadd45 family protein [Anaeroplasmataceae bacterium]MDE6413837.1 ribosomal L7Ae/L30e/S12e/Gadd45 family protein [Anaeroplasmataceae bacterium]
MDKILNNLGLCQRAGGLLSGEDSVLNDIATGKIHYLFLAKDASDNTKKKFKDKASFYQIEIDESYTSNELSHAIGKTNRMVIGIVNQGFLKILKK